MNYEPFNYGIIQNIKLTFFHKGKCYNWELPTLEEAEANKYFNYRENEYYSCC